MAILEVDMGNTCSKWRLRDGQRILQRGICLSTQFPDETLLALMEVDHIVLAAVCDIEVSQRASQKLREIYSDASFRCAETTANQSGVCNAYTEPSDMGVDRWLAMLAAFNSRSSSAVGVMVVSCGTAFTLDFVRADGVHEGGYILPGLTLMRDSLVSNTGRIRVEPAAFELQREPGNGTSSAVQNGALHCLLSTLEYSYRLCGERWDTEPELSLTGGDRAIVGEALSIPHRCVEDLVLDGLHYI